MSLPILSSDARVGRGKTSRVLFIWAIRDPAHLNWVAPALHAALHNSTRASSGQLSIEIQIFVTQKSNKSILELQHSLNEKPSTESMAPNYKARLNDNKAGSVMSTSFETLAQAVEGSGGKIGIERGRPNLQKLLEEELALSDGLKVSVDGMSPRSNFRSKCRLCP